MRLKRLVVLPIIAVLVLALAGCGSSSDSNNHRLTVFAAASLTEPFTALGKAFEKAHPGTTVEFSFGASSDLATQVSQGAPADVLATASTTTMDLVADEVSGRQDFARNTMEIAVPAKNPGQVTSLADLARPGVKVAVCQAQVPCGTVAAKVFANAKLHLTPVTEEADVKSVLTKVSLGEVDAGVVYVSDVKTAGSSVTGIPIPDAVNAVTTYPIATVKDSKNASLAKDFEDFVLGGEGQKTLSAAGFAQP